eukprot:3936911-Amphidinium_carterae.1
MEMRGRASECSWRTTKNRPPPKKLPVARFGEDANAAQSKQLCGIPSWAKSHMPKRQVHKTVRNMLCAWNHRRFLVLVRVALVCVKLQWLSSVMPALVASLFLFSGRLGWAKLCSIAL